MNLPIPDSTTENTPEVVQPAVVTPKPITVAALKHFTPEKQKQIVELSEAIDVLQFDKVKAYGSAPVIGTMESCDRALKDYEGTSADKEVIKQVRELAKQANEKYDDFNLAVREAGPVEKLLRKLFSKASGQCEGDLKLKAISCFKMLQQLANSCEEWQDLLRKTFEHISLSAYEEKQSCYELEEYLLAGRIAEERISKEVEQAKIEWEQSGLLAAHDKYKNLKDGFEVFQVVLLNLEKSRLAYAISSAQLALEDKANKRIQIGVQTQQTHSIMVAKQQIRNAVFDAANREALEGQKSVAKLNSELMKKVASNAVLTAKEAEEVLYNGVYTVEAAMEAAQTVINGCKEIEAASVDFKEAMAPQMEKLKSIFDELTPFVAQIKNNNANDSNASKSSSVKSGLVF